MLQTKLSCKKTLPELTSYMGLELWWFVHPWFKLYFDKKLKIKRKKLYKLICKLYSLLLYIEPFINYLKILFISIFLLYYLLYKRKYTINNEEKKKCLFLQIKTYNGEL